MHPELTTIVYVIIAVVFAAFMIVLLTYTRRMNINKAAMDQKGRLPINEKEGILLATREKEGRTEPPTP